MNRKASVDFATVASGRPFFVFSNFDVGVVPAAFLRYDIALTIRPIVVGLLYMAHDCVANLRVLDPVR